MNDKPVQDPASPFDVPYCPKCYVEHHALFHPLQKVPTDFRMLFVWGCSKGHGAWSSAALGAG